MTTASTVLIRSMTKSLKENNPILSIIILNYNSGNYLKKCLESLSCSSLPLNKFEIIIVDNGSTDNSISLAKNLKLLNSRFYLLDSNSGFSAGNNQGIKISNQHSKYLLFLNPDTVVEPHTLTKMIEFFNSDLKPDAATCKINLAKTGQIQPECHRDFPTPIAAFLHFSGLSSRTYFMQYLDYAKTQKINACVGAFLMVKKRVGESIGWWNEKYFFYGEDLDFCYKLKQKNYRLYYYPGTSITHYQGISSGIKKTESVASRQTRIRSALASTQAMRIFYQENLFKNYSFPVRFLVLSGIKLLEVIRVLKAKYL